MHHHPRDPHDDPQRRHRHPPPGQVPTIGDMQASGFGGWVWAHCDGCSYKAPMTLAAAAIVYGADASSDAIRVGALCPACGHAGVSLRVPSWDVSHAGEPGSQRFPTFYRAGLWDTRPFDPEERPAAVWLPAPKKSRPREPAYFRFKIKRGRDER